MNTNAFTAYSSGLKDTLHLQPEDINVWDWAWGLQHQGRFSGSTTVMWSVLSHLGLVRQLAMIDTKGELNPIDEVGILLHDASEGYMVDMPRPIKITQEWQFFRGLETSITDTIFLRFGLTREMVNWDLIHRYDNQALHIEFKTFFPHITDKIRIPPEIYPMAKFPELVVAKPKDYVDHLRHLAINLRETVMISDFDGLFLMPSHLAPYVDAPEAPPLLDADERSTLDMAILNKGID